MLIKEAVMLSSKWNKPSYNNFLQIEFTIYTFASIVYKKGFFKWDMSFKNDTKKTVDFVFFVKNLITFILRKIFNNVALDS